MSKYTPWFPPEIKPVHVGVYEIGDPYVPPWFRQWDGASWHGGQVTVKGAAKDKWSLTADARWRGLARKP